MWTPRFACGDGFEVGAHTQASRLGWVAQPLLVTDKLAPPSVCPWYLLPSSLRRGGVAPWGRGLHADVGPALRPHSDPARGLTRAPCFRWGSPNSERLWHLCGSRSRCRFCPRAWARRMEHPPGARPPVCAGAAAALAPSEPLHFSDGHLSTCWSSVDVPAWQADVGEPPDLLCPNPRG